MTPSGSHSVKTTFLSSAGPKWCRDVLNLTVQKIRYKRILPHPAQVGCYRKWQTSIEYRGACGQCFLHVYSLSQIQGEKNLDIFPSYCACKQRASLEAILCNTCETMQHVNRSVHHLWLNRFFLSSGSTVLFHVLYIFWCWVTRLSSPFNDAYLLCHTCWANEKRSWCKASTAR